MMLCRLYKWRISCSIDDECALSEAVKKHLLKCPGCRAFFSTSLLLAERLPVQAELLSAEIPARVHGEVSRMISQEMKPEKKEAGYRRRMVAAAAVLIVWLGVIAIALLREKPVRVADSDEYVEASRKLREIFAADGLMQENLVESLPGLLERPVSGELRNIADETESAVRFLLACLTVQNPMPVPEQ